MQAPRLDPRTWDDLRRELLRRVPVHAPEWTDLGPSDPGVALLELFAWLGERLLRRMDSVPAESEGAFLRLLGMPPRAARPSRAWVVASQSSDWTNPVRVEVDGASPPPRLRAGAVEFQVCDELCVLPVEPLAVIKRLSSAAQGSEDLRASAAAIVGDHLAGLGGGEPDPVFYETERLSAPVAGRLGEPVHLAGAVDGALWIALLAPESARRQVGMSALRRALAGRILSVGVVVDGGLGGDFERGEAGGARPAAAEVSWQISTGTFLGDQREDQRVDRVRYERLRVESDRTEGLARTGIVRLRLPAEIGDLAAWRLIDGEGNALSGMGELPPALDDDRLEERVLAWIRAFRPEDAPPVLRWATVNVVEVEQSVAQRAEILGRGDGQPGQRFTLSRAPVIADSVVIEVREADPIGWAQWRAVPDLASSRPDDLHFVLDPVTGEIRFGDGVQGRMPRDGEAVRARAWRVGGGAAGNVPAGAISQIEGYSQLKVSNPLAAAGGRDGETDAEARARAPTALRNQDRAVSPSDFRELALMTPGHTIGRAEVLPLHRPDDPGASVPGAITVVVLPAWDPAHPDEPAPEREAARAVLDWLEPRRLVTTELYVRGPVYVPVWMSVALELAEGFGPTTVCGWVEMALRQHFAPLPPYGPTGQGWPMGREVRRDDVLAAALAVRGVRLVRQALLLGPDGAPTTAVPLRAWELPVVRGVAVATGESAPDPSAPVAPASGSKGVSVAVPVVRERC